MLGAQKNEGGKIRAIIVTFEMILTKLFTHINRRDMERYDKEAEATETHAMRSDTKHFRP
jgi:hypothetical protein